MVNYTDGEPLYYLKHCGLTDGELWQYLKSCILTDDELLQYLKSCMLTDGELLQYLKSWILTDGELLQYYLDLSSPYIKMGEEGEGGDPALDEDGYLRMSSTSDYTPMSPTSPTSPTSPPLATLDEDLETGDKPHYINQHSFPREKGSDIEMQPLIDAGGTASSERRSSIPDEVAPGFAKGDSPMQVRTMAEVHQPDDSDSGHSSSYAPGTSPTDNSGYLLPKAYEAAAEAPSNPKTLGAEGGSEEEKDVRDSAFSPTNSVFSPDYHLNSYPPPDYRLVVEEGGQQDLPV